MTYSNLRDMLEKYNWDDGFEIPQKIIDDKNCDLALALEVFYLADGTCYLDDPQCNPGLDIWKRFIAELYGRIVAGEFKKTEIAYKIPLSKVAIYKFRKKQIPEVFLTDL